MTRNKEREAQTPSDVRMKKKISEVIEIIKEEIVRNLHPKSIILKGSFGSDEISAKFDGNKLVFLSDCEVIIIPTWKMKGGEPKKLSEELTKKMRLKVEITGIEPELKFCIALRLWNKILPTIDNYELKHSSKIIYGKNFLEKLPNIKAENVPVWEGIRLLFNRMIESLQYFSPDFLSEYPSKEKEHRLFYWTNKIILACQDALLILVKKYHHSYKVRNEVFQRIFPKYFEALDEKITDFLLLTVKATEYKLNPSTIYSKDVVGFWFQVAEIVDKVLRYIVEKDMGIRFGSYAQFQEKYLEHTNIMKKYYRGLSPNIIYQNLRSAVKILALGCKIPVIIINDLIRKITVPWVHIVYSAIPIVYFSVLPNIEVNKSLLERTRRIPLISQNKSNAKKELFDMWHAICY